MKKSWGSVSRGGFAATVPLPFAGQVALNTSINSSWMGWAAGCSGCCCCQFPTWSLNLWAIMPLITKKASLSAFCWCAATVSAEEDGKDGWARWVMLAAGVFPCSLGQIWECVVWACLFTGNSCHVLKTDSWVAMYYNTDVFQRKLPERTDQSRAKTKYKLRAFEFTDLITLSPAL